MEARKNRLKNAMTLPSVDDLFTTEEQRQEERLQRIHEILLSEIHDFEGHPYKVRNDEAMQNLTDSVIQRGIQTPVLVRPLEGGGYEMVSGHRRKMACELAGLERIPAIIREMTRDEAIIEMVESNYQRDIILPSEKAFAYKMKMEAIKRQAGRPSKDNSGQLGQNILGSVSRDELAEKSNDSSRQIHRYIRLTELSEQLLDMVDEKKLPLNTAVEVSYLPPELQSDLIEAMTANECIPSISQAQRLKEAAQIGKLDQNGIMLVLSEEKPVESKITLKGESVDRFFPKGYTPRDKERYILKALEHYSRFLQRQRVADRER